MTFPVPGASIAPLGHFGTLRPLDAAVKTHVHGALDLTAPMGTAIVAPERGMLYAFWLYVPPDRAVPFARDIGFPFPWRSHRADLYGGVLVLATEHRTHLMGHLYMKQLLRYTPIDAQGWDYMEEEADTRWPAFIWHTFGELTSVEEGDVIGRVGNAGYSTGPHVHWEIHRGWADTAPAERINPEQLIKEE